MGGRAGAAPAAREALVPPAAGSPRRASVGSPGRPGPSGSSLRQRGRCRPRPPPRAPPFRSPRPPPPAPVGNSLALHGRGQALPRDVGVLRPEVYVLAGDGRQVIAVVLAAAATALLPDPREPILHRAVQYETTGVRQEARLGATPAPMVITLTRSVGTRRHQAGGLGAPINVLASAALSRRRSALEGRTSITAAPWRPRARRLRFLTREARGQSARRENRSRRRPDLTPPPRPDPRIRSAMLGQRDPLPPLQAPPRSTPTTKSTTDRAGSRCSPRASTRRAPGRPAMSSTAPALHPDPQRQSPGRQVTRRA